MPIKTERDGLRGLAAYDPAVLHWSLRLGILVALLATAVLVIHQVDLAWLRSGQRSPGMIERIYGDYAQLVWTIVRTAVGLLTIGLFAWPAQWLFPVRKSTYKVRTYEFWLDLLYSIQGIWLGSLSFFLAINWLIDAIYRGSGNWLPFLAELPFWVQVVAAIWAFDMAVYWRHRFEHTFSALWSFHAVHHSTERVDFLTTTRLHPFELALGAIVNAAVIRCGLDPAATGLGFFIYLKYNYFIHTNVRIRFPGFLKYILVSPFMHHWHHAKDPVAAGKNVGVVFAWNDFLFGTAYHPEHWPEAYGFDGPQREQVGQSYVRQLLYPIQFATARIRPAVQSTPPG